MEQELSPLESTARAFAVERHGKQQYGEHPYVFHLERVREVLVHFDHSEPLRVAGLLHDVLEDTPTTREEVRERFGAEVEALVWAVTGVGATRLLRNASMYEKVRAHPDAATLKLADRIANATASQSSPPKLAMYRAEMESFREHLTGLGDARMWARLEALLG